MIGMTKEERLKKLRKWLRMVYPEVHIIKTDSKGVVYYLEDNSEYNYWMELRERTHSKQGTNTAYMDEHGQITECNWWGEEKL